MRDATANSLARHEDTCRSAGVGHFAVPPPPPINQPVGAEPRKVKTQRTPRVRCSRHIRVAAHERRFGWAAGDEEKEGGKGRWRLSLSALIRRRRRFRHGPDSRTPGRPASGPRRSAVRLPLPLRATTAARRAGLWRFRTGTCAPPPPLRSVPTAVLLPVTSGASGGTQTDGFVFFFLAPPPPPLPYPPLPHRLTENVYETASKRAGKKKIKTKKVSHLQEPLLPPDHSLVLGDGQRELRAVLPVVVVIIIVVVAALFSSSSPPPPTVLRQLLVRRPQVVHRIAEARVLVQQQRDVEAP
ncbi:MAG: hypothetical protein BJ554DRAFT_1547, partial [Olpidium bornovanus]